GSFRLQGLRDFQGSCGIQLLRNGHHYMRSARTVTTSRINMTSHQSGRGPRRSRGGRSRRRGGDRFDRPKYAQKAPAKKTLWEKITGFFSGKNGKQQPAKPRPETTRNGSQAPRPQSRKPESVEVT